MPNAVTPRLARARQKPPPFGVSNSSIRLTVMSDIALLLVFAPAGTVGCSEDERDPANSTCARRHGENGE
jgi:hypothetical protein